MLAYDIKVKTNNKLSAAAKRFIIPLQNVAKELAILIQARVKSGLNPENRKWSNLGRKSKRSYGNSSDPEEVNRWWVNPNQPQPSGYLFKIAADAKKFANYAVYKDYETYLSLSPNGKTRDWYKSGQFWRSIAVRPQSVNKVKIISSGSRKAGNGKRIANRDIGRYVGKDEDFNVLSYSDPEREVVVNFAKEQINDELAKRLVTAGQIEKLDNRGIRANARARRLAS
jgi:hypothetical protein